VCLREAELGGRFLLRPVEEEAQQQDPALPRVERAGRPGDQRPIERRLLDGRLIARPLVLHELERRLRSSPFRRVVRQGASRNPHGSHAVAQMPSQLAVDGPIDVRGQELAAPGIAPVDRADDGKCSDLLEVVALDAATREPLRCAVREREVQLDQAASLGVTRDHGSMLCRREDKWNVYWIIFSYVATNVWVHVFLDHVAKLVTRSRSLGVRSRRRTRREPRAR
jgi:hypothetical protein